MSELCSAVPGTIDNRSAGVAVAVTIMFVSQDDALKIRCEIVSDIDVTVRLTNGCHRCNYLGR